MRIAVLALCGVAVAWSIFVIKPAWYAFPVDQTAKAVMRGERFPAATLQARLADLDANAAPICSATIAHTRAVIQIALLAQSFGSSDRPIDQQLEATRGSILAGLACLPSDAYLWFALFQVESLRTGFRDGYLSYLAMSYRQSPNEGWIAIPRNRLAFAIFSNLDERLQAQVIDEFCLMVGSQLYQEAIDIYLGPATPYRERIAAMMYTVPPTARQLFALQLARLGIDPKIPGTSIVVRRHL